MALKTKAIQAIKNYKNTKHLTTGSGRCKHYPSCSNYAIECYEKFNFIKATCLTAWRLIRCNPLTRKVYDPVPLTKKEKQELKQRTSHASLIIPIINEFYHDYPLSKTLDYVQLIYRYSFKNDTKTNDEIVMFNERLYVFKQLVKQKKLPLNYHEVFQEINDYLNHSKTLEEPKNSDVFIANYKK